MKEDIKREVVLKEGVTATVSNNSLTVKGAKGEVTRNFAYPKVTIKVDAGKVTLSTVKGTKREKKIIATFESHIKNLVQGVQEPHTYKLKICSGHFPMNVAVSGKELVVKNFLGEAVPRKVSLPEGADVKVNGDEIVVSSVDKEIAGQAAARIEKLCRITDRDLRIFQDGIYIIEKAGKTIA